MTAPSEDSQGCRRLRILFRCAAIVLGVAETWATRHSMGADGIAYLDMGDAYLRGDWHMAINSIWSPFYSWLLGLALKILKPSAYWEFPVVHLANLAIYLGAFASFEYLLSGLVKKARKEEPGAENELANLPPWAWYGIGYTLFLWVSFELMRLETVTPDMCVAALVYLASGLIVRIRGGSTAWLTFTLLGIVLGFGYLAKGIMFPLSFIFLGVALFSAGDLRKAAPSVLAAAAIFLAIGAPLIVALSVSLGRPTFGEVGRYNYIQDVNHPDYWLPTNAFTHPIKRIYDRPLVTEFARPIKSTFPLWYDPAYWWQGFRPHFDLKGHIRTLKANAIAYYGFLFLKEAGLVAGLIVLFCVTPGPLVSLKAVCENWHLLIPALAGLGAYSLLHFDGRLIGPFVLLLWLGILAGVRLQNLNEFRKLIAGAVVAIMVTMGGPVLSSTFFDVAAARHKAPVDWQVAQALNGMGIQPGDKTALIRHETPSSPWADFYWARLARVRIIAEIPPEEVDKFWASGPTVQADVMNAFARVGAKAIITNDPPPSASAATWHKLGNTDFYAYLPR